MLAAADHAGSGCASSSLSPSANLLSHIDSTWVGSRQYNPAQTNSVADANSLPPTLPSAFEEFLSSSSSQVADRRHAGFPRPTSPPATFPELETPYVSDNEDEFSSEWSNEAFTARQVAFVAPQQQQPPRATPLTADWAREFAAASEHIADAEAHWLAAVGARNEWNWATVFQRAPAAPADEEAEDGPASSIDTEAERRQRKAELLAAASKRRLRMLLAQLTGSSQNDENNLSFGKS
ncbi:hypothetical protein HDU87_005974 [Geranomyces variabilis]|uniref:Uncharacterized protein n=1 Tax=Geranomyces variabilis TaxID=109894 RepID=A0AAD5TQP8_9FUNG|nr:hypothetical protein HDU87_005974 [Geranomyces variabilis]